MRLVVFHYHLNRGGVTSVIRSHLKSLASSRDVELEHVALAHGGRAADWSQQSQEGLPFPVEQMIVPSLEYDDVSPDGRDLSNDILNLLNNGGYSRDDTVLHVHNHSLGKNTALPSTAIILANGGWRILFQIHDFVEDLRPANYQHLLAAFADEQELWSNLYPQSPQMHYAVLNTADQKALESAGVAQQRLHLLPNPVETPTSGNEDTLRMAAREKLGTIYSVSSDSAYVLYPVRGIRRKNLGELLLWSLLLDDCTFSITLDPKNEKERTSYLYWKDLSQSLTLPVVFGSGEHLSLEENYAAADAIITTSVAEGFGLVFLEAALRNRPLFGRNLPGVTADFKEHGMRFPGLADELLIPCSAVDVDAQQIVYDQLTRKLREDYGCSAGAPTEAQRIPSVSKENIDFGRLDRQQQSAVISNVKSDDQLKEAIITENSVVQRARKAFMQDNLTEMNACAMNRKVIEQHYSHETIGRELAGIYHELLREDCGSVDLQPDIGRNLLDHFVRPEHLFPLRIQL